MKLRSNLALAILLTTASAGCNSPLSASDGPSMVLPITSVASTRDTMGRFSMNFGAEYPTSITIKDTEGKFGPGDAQGFAVFEPSTDPNDAWQMTHVANVSAEIVYPYTLPAAIATSDKRVAIYATFSAKKRMMNISFELLRPDKAVVAQLETYACSQMLVRVRVGAGGHPGFENLIIRPGAPRDPPCANRARDIINGSP